MVLYDLDYFLIRAKFFVVQFRLNGGAAAVEVRELMAELSEADEVPVPCDGDDLTKQREEEVFQTEMTKLSRNSYESSLFADFHKFYRYQPEDASQVAELKARNFKVS